MVMCIKCAQMCIKCARPNCAWSVCFSQAPRSIPSSTWGNEPQRWHSPMADTQSSEHIEITVRNQDNDDVKFKIKRNTNLGKVC